MSPLPQRPHACNRALLHARAMQCQCVIQWMPSQRCKSTIPGIPKPWDYEPMFIEVLVYHPCPDLDAWVGGVELLQSLMSTHHADHPDVADACTPIKAILDDLYESTPCTCTYHHIQSLYHPR